MLACAQLGNLSQHVNEDVKNICGVLKNDSLDCVITSFLSDFLLQ